MSDYAEQKFFEAVFSLVGPGEWRDRMRAAAMALCSLQPRDFPNDETCERWKPIYEDLSFATARYSGEGQIQATIAAMPEFDARQIAQRIFELYNELVGLGRVKQVQWG